MTWSGAGIIRAGETRAGRARSVTGIARSAQIAMRRIRETSTRDVVQVRVYECPLCRGFHMTSQENR